MAIHGYYSTLSNAQAITASAYSTNELDFDVADPDIGIGTRKMLNIVVNTNFTLDTDSDLTVKIATGAATAPTTMIWISQTYATNASLVKGTRLMRMQIPHNVLRFMRFHYVNSATAWTAGKLDAYITLED